MSLFFRPWIARVLNKGLDDKIEVQWYKKDESIPRHDRKIQFSKTSAKDHISTETIMHWLIGSERPPVGFVLSRTELVYISNLYAQHDASYV